MNSATKDKEEEERQESIYATGPEAQEDLARLQEPAETSDAGPATGTVVEQPAPATEADAARSSGDAAAQEAEPPMLEAVEARPVQAPEASEQPATDNLQEGLAGLGQADPAGPALALQPSESQGDLPAQAPDIVRQEGPNTLQGAAGPGDETSSDGAGGGTEDSVVTDVRGAAPEKVLASIPSVDEGPSPKMGQSAPEPTEAPATGEENAKKETIVQDPMAAKANPRTEAKQVPAKPLASSAAELPEEGPKLQESSGKTGQDAHDADEPATKAGSPTKPTPLAPPEPGHDSPQLPPPPPPAPKSQSHASVPADESTPGATHPPATPPSAGKSDRPQPAPKLASTHHAGMVPPPPPKTGDASSLQMHLTDPGKAMGVASAKPLPPAAPPSQSIAGMPRDSAGASEIAAGATHPLAKPEVVASGKAHAQAALPTTAVPPFAEAQLAAGKSAPPQPAPKLASTHHAGMVPPPPPKTGDASSLQMHLTDPGKAMGVASAKPLPPAAPPSQSIAGVPPDSAGASEIAPGATHSLAKPEVVASGKAHAQAALPTTAVPPSAEAQLAAGKSVPPQPAPKLASTHHAGMVPPPPPKTGDDSSLQMHLTDPGKAMGVASAKPLPPAAPPSQSIAGMPRDSAEASEIAPGATHSLAKPEVVASGKAHAQAALPTTAVPPSAEAQLAAVKSVPPQPAPKLASTHHAGMVPPPPPKTGDASSLQMHLTDPGKAMGVASAKPLPPAAPPSQSIAGVPRDSAGASEIAPGTTHPLAKPEVVASGKAHAQAAHPTTAVPPSAEAQLAAGKSAPPQPAPKLASTHHAGMVPPPPPKTGDASSLQMHLTDPGKAMGVASAKPLPPAAPPSQSIAGVPPDSAGASEIAPGATHPLATPEVVAFGKAHAQAALPTTAVPPSAEAQLAAVKSVPPQPAPKLASTHHAGMVPPPPPKTGDASSLQMHLTDPGKAMGVASAKPLPPAAPPSAAPPPPPPPNAPKPASVTLGGPPVDTQPHEPATPPAKPAEAPDEEVIRKPASRRQEFRVRGSGP